PVRPLPVLARPEHRPDAVPQVEVREEHLRERVLCTATRDLLERGNVVERRREEVPEDDPSVVARDSTGAVPPVSERYCEPVAFAIALPRSRHVRGRGRGT